MLRGRAATKCHIGGTGHDGDDVGVDAGVDDGGVDEGGGGGGRTRDGVVGVKHDDDSFEVEMV